MFDEKIGFLVVGETHLSATQAEEIQEALGRRMDIYHLPNPENPSTRGITIVLNREITNTKGVKVWYLKPLLCFPGTAVEPTLYWESMPQRSQWKKTRSFGTNYMICDMNIVEELIDRPPHRRDNDATVAALARFKQLLGLEDDWRKTNPETKEYTYSSGHQTHSRLDRVYIRAPGSPYIGKGRYTIPLFLLRDKEFINNTTKLGAELEAKTVDNPEDATKIQSGFKQFKDDIREFTRKWAKVAVGALEGKKRKLQKERDAILKDTPPERNCEAEPQPQPDLENLDSSGTEESDEQIPESEDSTEVKLAAVQRAIDLIHIAWRTSRENS
ncbi:hypothetical protein C8F04DRAFT_1311390 [Mycena alexandri]|uniref:Uncharacterized protein n=1 Tax=Mycena alexandri TaxID=1745969 RepID=A0AAD6S7M3_9AGAR|nr:hypothetical protein C8F04DRAFT_1311390 [Mycena alexandri]